MTNYRQFLHYFWRAISKVQSIFFGLFTWLAINAAAIAFFEKMRYSEALYFTLVTGLTIGYGDISPVTAGGRIVAILTGLIGILFTGIVVAVAVYAVKQTLASSIDEK